jgi:VRR-NUC domain-containing protein
MADIPDSDTSEASLVRRLLLASSKLGARLFRNQVGRYRLARPGCMECQRYGRMLSSGLAVGSPDLVGWHSVTIGHEHVGRTLAVFVGVEAKREDGKLSEEQRAFLAALARAGAIAGVARSVTDLEVLVGQANHHKL